MNNIKFSAMSNQELARMLFTYPGMAEEIIAASENVSELYALVEEELIPDGQINDDGDVDNNLQVRKILQKITGYMHNDPNHDIWENVWEKFSDDMRSLSRNKREASARFDIEADEELDDFYLKNPEMDDRPDSQIPEGMTQEEYFEAMGVSINEFGEIIRSEPSPKKTIKEMSEEELTQIWVDNPEVLKELLSESELSIEELASLYVNHNILKNDILQMCDPEELLKTIREQMREERIQYTHPLFSDESKSLTEKEQIYKKETKKYADAIREIEDYIWMQEYDFSEPLEYDESYVVERKAELSQRKAEIEKRIAELDMLDDERLALGNEGYELSMLSIELEEIIEQLEAYEAVEKTPLQQREEELLAAEAEARTISEAEALIDKQNQKNGEQK